MVQTSAELLDTGSWIDHPKVVINRERCAGCQECVIRCPSGALSIDPVDWKASADSSLCVGCRQCTRTCPFSAIDVYGGMVVDERIQLPLAHPTSLKGDISETRPGLSSWDQALSEASRCLSCPDPTCVRGCPAHNDIPAFITAIKDRDLERAHTILARTTYMPDICSRVCDYASQCEGACSWNLAGGAPVAIGALERFVTDNAPVPGVKVTSDIGAGLSVAVVGSGPAGIAAAWELISAGASVTMFEKDKEPLGVLRWGIPSFSLPWSVATRPISALLEAGLVLRTNTEIKPDDVGKLLQEHDAVVLAHGSSVPLRLPVPGSDLKGVEDATSFLSRTKKALEAGQLLDDLSDGAKVLVLGAGNTAMDAARTARRFGAEALAIDWMDRRFARVRADELAEAVTEGVEVRFKTSLQRIEGVDGRVRRAWLVTTKQRSATELPQIIKGSEFAMDVDIVVMAMGFRSDPAFQEKILPGTPFRPTPFTSEVPDRSWQASGIFSSPVSKVGFLARDREKALQRAEQPFGWRVWAAGDGLVGPSTVVAAMAQGKRAAQSLLARLGKTSSAKLNSSTDAVSTGRDGKVGTTGSGGIRKVSR